MSNSRHPLFSALVFDFDGTLAQPVLDFKLMQQAGLKALGDFLPIPPDRTRLTLECVDELTQGLPFATAAAARQAALDAFASVEVEAAGRASLFSFARPVFSALKKRNLPFAIITRNCREAVHACFPDVAQHCACLLTREDVERVKPDPEHLLLALRRLNCPPGRALMIGDHPIDILVGKKAGVKTAAVASAESSRSTLARENPDYIADDTGQLMSLLGIDI